MEYIIGIGAVVFLIYWFANRNNKVAEPKPKTKTKPRFILTEEFEEILKNLNNSNESIFITGKAGTGKSSLLNHFIKKTSKNYVILAPTGIAALNVSGQTIHSFFRFPPTIINPDKIKPDYVRSGLFEKLDMIIIDEVSMVRVDLMNGVDVALRKNRNRLSEPFGGVQMIFIGDLFQLPPVLNNRDRVVIKESYEGQYFFDAPVFRKFNYQFKELTRVFRQSDEEVEFKKLLNNVRVNAVKFEDMSLLNSRHRDNAGEHENSIFLTTKRDIARNINRKKLDLLSGEEMLYIGALSGKYLKLKNENEDKVENKLPAPYKLKLKKGAQIMMLKNDSGKRWVNGTIGKVDKLETDKILVKIDGRRHIVEKDTWEEVEYILNKKSGKFEENVIASFTQYPIRLSYAMTIHKSQGKTFNKITVDVGTGAFAHGQIYVAISRCTTLNGIILSNPINDKDIIVDPRIVEFYKKKCTPPKESFNDNSSNIDNLRHAISNGIKDKKKIKIDYEKNNGEISTRHLSNIQISNEFGKFGYENDHIKAFCHLRNEERNFKIDRIRSIEIME